MFLKLENIGFQSIANVILLLKRERKRDKERKRERERERVYYNTNGIHKIIAQEIIT